MSGKNIFCFQCQSSSSYDERVSFRAECPHCSHDLHVCKNCEFYDPGAYNECRESSADKVQDKEKNNVCEYFKPSSKPLGSSSDNKKLLEQAEALFRKKDK